jgi:hypothetical protein
MVSSCAAVKPGRTRCSFDICRIETTGLDNIISLAFPPTQEPKAQRHQVVEKSSQNCRGASCQLPTASDKTHSGDVLPHGVLGVASNSVSTMFPSSAVDRPAGLATHINFDAHGMNHEGQPESHCEGHTERNCHLGRVSVQPGLHNGILVRIGTRVPVLALWIQKFGVVAEVEKHVIDICAGASLKEVAVI